MKLKYITTVSHGYNTSTRCIQRTDLTRLGYIVNSEFSTYQNYDSRSGTVGYWHIIHNDTGMSIGMVKNRKDIKKVLDRYNTSLFTHASVNEYGFIEWDDRSAKAELHAAWQDMRDSGLIVL